MCVCILVFETANFQKLLTFEKYILIIGCCLEKKGSRGRKAAKSRNKFARLAGVYEMEVCGATQW